MSKIIRQSDAIVVVSGGDHGCTARIALKLAAWDMRQMDDSNAACQSAAAAEIAIASPQY